MCLQTGPPQYRSRTVFEDATPEMVREFFWDDEFRLKWDDMLLQASTLEECQTTGTMVVQWVRKVREALLCVMMRESCFLYAGSYFFAMAFWNSFPSSVATENT